MLVSVFYQIIEKLFLTSQSIPDSDTIPSGHVQLLHMVPGKIQLASGGVHSVFLSAKTGREQMLIIFLFFLHSMLGFRGTLTGLIRYFDRGFRGTLTGLIILSYLRAFCDRALVGRRESTPLAEEFPIVMPTIPCPNALLSYQRVSNIIVCLRCA